MAVELDDVDIQLLTALQQDADRTNVELARLAGLSPAATLHRVRRLKETGVIRVISAQLDPAAAGFPLQVYVTATLARHDPHSSRVFDDMIRALPQVIAPRAGYVRAFNALGWENFASPLPGTNLFFAAAPEARAVAEELISAVGLEPAFVGDASATATVDALLPLWFALVRQNGGNRRLALRVIRAP